MSWNTEIVLELPELREKLTFASAEVAEAVRKFMRERLNFHLETVVGLRYDTIRAAMGARQSVFEPSQVLARARAIERIRSSDDFLSLSQSAKRIRNILNKSAQPSDFEGRAFDPQRLEAGPERDMYAASERVQEEAAQKRAAGDIHGALGMRRVPARTRGPLFRQGTGDGRGPGRAQKPAAIADKPGSAFHRRCGLVPD